MTKKWIKNCALVLLMHISLGARDIILWDLHGVVLERSTSSTLKALASANLAKGIANLTWAQLRGLIVLGLDNLIHEKSGEEYIHIAIKADNLALANAIISIANSWKIMPGIESVIEELNQLGLEQDIGSNIGRTLFDRLIKEPEFAPIFCYMNLNRSQVVEFTPPHLVKKPNSLFFKEYLDKNRLNPAKTHIIFIDDQKVNVTAARQMGLIGIYFKNVNQLRQDLRELGIEVSPPIQKQIHFEGYKHLFE